MQSQQEQEHPNNEQPQSLSTMLSPRNIMKFFTKNIQEMASPRIAAFISNTRSSQSRSPSSFSEEEIASEFGNYLSSINEHMKKFKANENKKNKVTSREAQKQRQKSELQTELKIQKIPAQYFIPDEKQKSTAANNKVQKLAKCDESGEKSTKLQELLQFDPKQKVRQKRLQLSQKQEQLQQYLDQIEVIIYKKTNKYPDRYLHYLGNLNNSDIQVIQLILKVKHVRQSTKHSLLTVNQKMMKIKMLQIKKKNIQNVTILMNTLRCIYKFKKESQGFSGSEEMNNNIKNSEFITHLQNDPKINQFHKLLCIEETLKNIEHVGTKLKSNSLQNFCKQLLSSISSDLSKIYSRQQWLKNEIPKDVILFSRLPQETQDYLSQNNVDANMNNSYMNISVLDQSYCVGNSLTNKSGLGNCFGFTDKGKIIIGLWKRYYDDYWIEGQKSQLFQEESQLIFEVLQRSILKFTHGFCKDLQDYMIHLYLQKVPNPQLWPLLPKPPPSPIPFSNQNLLYYISPKFYNKILKIYFQSLSTCLFYSFPYLKLPNFMQKILSLVQQKIGEILGLRNLSNFELIQKGIVAYEDVVELLGVLEFWSDFIMQCGNKLQQFQDEIDMDILQQKLMQFESNLQKTKQTIIEQYLSNLHQYALVKDLKELVQTDTFNMIHIPTNAFIVLDFILNFGQDQPTGSNNQISDNPMQQSFLNSDVLGDLDDPLENKKGKFSIFKIIDKKLIIEGVSYEISQSVLLLIRYLATYLKSKIDYPELSVQTQQRICELIGFYIWYCKKIVITGAQKKTQHQIKSQKIIQEQSVGSHILNSVGVGAVAKGFGGIKNVVNGFIDKSGKHFNDNEQKINHPKVVEVTTVKKSVSTLCMLMNLCDLLLKLLDILDIRSKPKKLDKVLTDLSSIKLQCLKQISMIPFIEVQQQVGQLYESRLKTRKQVPTHESLKIIQILENTRKQLQQYLTLDNIRKALEPTVIKNICKNYFGYLLNMESRGKSELKWFLPKVKELVGDLFEDQVLKLQQQLRY